MKNQPYVKIYDENNFLTNPIIGSYQSPFANRRTRRARPTRFIGNNAGNSLTVRDTTAYHRCVQIINDTKNGGIKRIEHYIQK